MSTKPSIVKGTRDFLPDVMAKRNYIFSTIKKVFDKYGFQPIETPSMETTKTLLGKYGEEGDKLIFRILKRGDKLNKELETADFNNKAKLANIISEEALRYDLTVPFARFVVMHQNDLIFPFKRYQIQPVWRADRPARGRYREFYQCDADVVGSDSLLNEVDLICIVDEVFEKLRISVKLEFNNRKILSGLSELFEVSENASDLFIALDKIDKIGDGIYNELRKKGFDAEKVNKIRSFIERVRAKKGREQVEEIKQVFQENEIGVGLKGIEEVEEVFNLAAPLIPSERAELITFNIALARGLSYYTGAIFEVKPVNTEFSSSIVGGGRYDDLTALFGLDGMSGVGISFGADRIYDVMTELELFPDEALATTQVLFVNFGEAEQKQSMKYAASLRDSGISCEVYPSAAKMKKQMKYANDRNIPFVVMVGSKELENNSLTYKNMTTGEQETANFNQLLAEII